MYLFYTPHLFLAEFLQLKSWNFFYGTAGVHNTQYVALEVLYIAAGRAVVDYAEG